MNRNVVVGGDRVNVPRDIKRVEANAVSEARLYGKRFFYTWKSSDGDDEGARGGKKMPEVTGLSIDGAHALRRIWGNNRVDSSVIEETDAFWVIQVRFVDFENGAEVVEVYQHSKPSVPNKSQKMTERAYQMMVKRDRDHAFQVGQSKAIRNVIEDSLPSWLVDACLKAAQENSHNGSDDKLRRDLVELMKRQNVRPEMMVAKMGKFIDEYSPKDYREAIQILNAIASGEASYADVFGGKQVIGEKEAKDLYEKLKANKSVAQDFMKSFGIERLRELESSRYEEACEWLSKCKPASATDEPAQDDASVEDVDAEEEPQAPDAGKYQYFTAKLVQIRTLDEWESLSGELHSCRSDGTLDEESASVLEESMNSMRHRFK